MMLSKDYAGCTLIIFGMGVAFLAAEPWSFRAILGFFVFDFSLNQPITGLGFAIAAIGGIVLARTSRRMQRRRR
jgi:hypothetical protein